MTYDALRARMTASLAVLRQQVAAGTAPPSAGLAMVLADELVELEQSGAPETERVVIVRQVLSAAAGMRLPLDFEAATA